MRQVLQQSEQLENDIYSKEPIYTPIVRTLCARPLDANQRDGEACGETVDCRIYGSTVAKIYHQGLAANPNMCGSVYFVHDYSVLRTP